MVLNAATPALALDATASLSSDLPVTDGEVGLSVFFDADAQGSIAVGLRSETSGERGELDVVDTQAQGSARIGIPAFAACEVPECTESMLLTFERTDEALEGDLTFSFQLDGYANTEGEPQKGELVFVIDR